MTDPAHTGRLVQLIAWAMILALALLGSRMIQAGLRRLLESSWPRRLSLSQIGLRFLMFCVIHDRPLSKNLSPVPS